MPWFSQEQWVVVVILPQEIHILRSQMETNLFPDSILDGNDGLL